MNLNRLTHFAAVVDEGSFTQAAKRLGISKAVVSQQVAQLERDLKTTLLIRTTRRVHPTEAGRLFHARCVQILREAEDAFAEMAAGQAVPTGTLRVTAPNDYGVAVVVPAMTDFTTRYAGCRVDLRLEDRTLDLVSDEIDIAIRVGWLSDSSLQARKIGAFRQLLVGHPALVARIGRITRPGDLKDTPVIANLALRKPLSFTFSHPGQAPEEVGFGSVISIDMTLGVMAATQRGGGLAVLPDYIVQSQLDSGALVHVLPDWTLPSGGIYMVFPSARYRPAKVLAFIEILRAAERVRTLRDHPDG